MIRVVGITTSRQAGLGTSYLQQVVVELAVGARPARLGVGFLLDDLREEVSEEEAHGGDAAGDAEVVAEEQSAAAGGDGVCGA